MATDWAAFRASELRAWTRAAGIAPLPDTAAGSEEHGLLLSLAVAAGSSTIQAGYDIANLHRSVDWIAVMAYDMHGEVGM